MKFNFVYKKGGENPGHWTRRPGVGRGVNTTDYYHHD